MVESKVEQLSSIHSKNQLALKQEYQTQIDALKHDLKQMKRDLDIALESASLIKKAHGTELQMMEKDIEAKDRQMVEVAKRHEIELSMKDHEINLYKKEVEELRLKLEEQHRETLNLRQIESYRHRNKSASNRN